MRYIKTFEDILIKKFWKVPTSDPDFLVATDKIGVPETNQNKIFDVIKRRRLNNTLTSTHIFISYNNSDRHANSGWHWGNDNNTSLVFYTNSNYNFEGEVDVSQEDIEKWEIKNNANKYNL